MTGNHPDILENLAAFLPSGGRRAETRLKEDLRLPETGIKFLSRDIERAWGIALSLRAIERWRTLGDVAASIADALQLEAA